MRFVILGAGAIGGVVAGFLTRAKREVVLLARGAHGVAISETGLRVETPTETFVVQPPVALHPGKLRWRDDDVIALAVKTQDAAAALRELAPPPEIPIVCMTNGVEAERIALRHARTVYGGYVMMPATHLSPGIVQAWAAPVPGAIDIGRYPHGDVSVAITSELRAAGFASEPRADIMRWKRGKLLSNLANGAEALCGPTARRSVVAELACREGRACFTAAGLSFTTDDEDATRREGLTSQPIAGATRGGGSTWQSLMRGSTLETDFLNGEIVLLGRTYGVATPINERLQALAADAAHRGVTPGAMSLEDLIASVIR